jgi:GxxExxY protein
MELLHKALTDSILKVYFDVYNELGYGFLEKVYRNSMYLEFKSRGFYVEAQKQIKVNFKGAEVRELCRFVDKRRYYFRIKSG